MSPHSVAIVISDLRKALGDDSRAPRYVETVPKRGYRLLAPAAPLSRGSGRHLFLVAIGLAILLGGAAA